MSWTLRLEDDPAGLCAQCRGQERAGMEAKKLGGMPRVPPLASYAVWKVSEICVQLVESKPKTSHM